MPEMSDQTLLQLGSGALEDKNIFVRLKISHCEQTKLRQNIQILRRTQIQTSNREMLNKKAQAMLRWSQFARKSLQVGWQAVGKVSLHGQWNVYWHLLKAINK